MSDSKENRGGAHIEFSYAKPFADALVVESEFREWVLASSPFSEYSSDARLLCDDMLEKRTKGTEYWWNSHFNGTCKCEGCIGGKETDLLAIFQGKLDLRFAIHFEIKHFGDKFKPEKLQAERYPVRAACWASNINSYYKGVNHHRAATALLCSPSNLPGFEEHSKYFDFILSIDEINVKFPNLWDHV